MRGYAILGDALEIGYIALGAAVRDHDGRAVAAVSVGRPTRRLTRRRARVVGQQVSAAARRLSLRLGMANGPRGRN